MQALSHDRPVDRRPASRGYTSAGLVLMDRQERSTSTLETDQTLEQIDSVTEHARKLVEAACLVLAPHELPPLARAAQVAIELGMFLLGSCITLEGESLSDPALRDALHLFDRLSHEMRGLVDDPV